jgi:ribosomal protein L20A (L18A)
MGPVVKASVRSKSASRRRVKRRYIGFRNVVSGSKEEVVTLRMG